MRLSTKIAMSTSTLALLLIGIALAMAGSQVDGFFGGMAQGAGAMMALIGGFLLVTLVRQPKGSDKTWLPSRDGDR